MDEPDDRLTHHRFCWADLATADDGRAADFYESLFHWSGRRREAGGGRFSTLEHDGNPLASLYRLTNAQIGSGVPSHWLAYVSTRDLEGTMARAVALGAGIVVGPQHVPGLARIAVIVDPTGALIGLWQSENPGDWTGTRLSRDHESRHVAGVSR